MVLCGVQGAAPALQPAATTGIEDRLKALEVRVCHLSTARAYVHLQYLVIESAHSCFHACESSWAASCCNGLPLKQSFVHPESFAVGQRYRGLVYHIQKLFLFHVAALRGYRLFCFVGIRGQPARDAAAVGQPARGAGPAAPDLGRIEETE